MGRKIKIIVVGAAFAVQTAAVFAQAQPEYNSDTANSSGAGAAGSSSSGVQSVNAAPTALPSLNGSSNRSVSRTADSSGVVTTTTTTTAPAPVSSGDLNSPGGNVAELQRRIAAKELSELRTTYNGSYGASLLITNNDPTYYVALFERKNFWRVIKTQNDTRAEAIFVDFARQTADLASTEIRAMKLEAQKSAAERLIEVNQQRAAQVQADLAVQQTQQQEVAGRQRDAQAQAAALDAETRKTQDQLDQLRRQLADLQRQADEGLPSPTASVSKRR